MSNVIGYYSLGFIYFGGLMRKVLVLMCLSLGLMFVFTNITIQANSPIHIEITSNTPVFDNRTGSLVKVGELVSGQQFTVVKDYGVNW